MHVKMKTPKFLLTLASYFSIAAGYDIKCIYPDGLSHDPFTALQHGAFFRDNMIKYEVETPVVVRMAHHMTMCRAMCLSLHDPHVLDPYFEWPTWTVPEFGQNAWSMVMCSGQCYTHVFEGFYDVNHVLTTQFNREYGTGYTLPDTRTDIQQAWSNFITSGNDALMQDIMTLEDYHPYMMGHIAGVYVRYFMDIDGWNADGSKIWDRAAQDKVDCTSSCRNYQDTIGYEPRVDPRSLGLVDDDKYTCVGDCRKWQPLQEGNDGGSLKRQEFVTPHIGENAHTFLRDSTLSLEDPEYDLYNDSLTVIDRLAITSNNVYMQDAVRFFDDKLSVRGAITNNVREQFAETREHSFQDELLSLIGISTAEYDGVVQAWHEKWYHDLVRPTTVIKHWGSDILSTYSGDDSIVGPVNIAARDFEAYVRVMPHAEFPSGSSCLCKAYAEFTDKFLEENYERKLTNIAWSTDGTWAKNDGTDRTYTLNNMDHLSDICGESRLWGGMHYTEAIEAGETICSGLGDLAYAYVQRLKNNATFSGENNAGPYYMGDVLGSPDASCL